MKRAIILKYVFVTGVAVPPIDVLTQWKPEEIDRFAAEFSQRSIQNVNRLKAAGLWPDVEEGERIFLHTGIQQVSTQQRIDAAWIAESLVCLNWALQFVSKVPAYDQEATPELINAVPAAESVKELIRQARLRPQEEIQKQRDIAELWHWRARTRRLQEEGHWFQLTDGYTIEQVIELAASKGAEDGDFAHPIQSDFPAMGKPYRDVSSEEFAILTSIAQERHKAFNWLCGYSSRGLWTDTPTNT